MRSLLRRRVTIQPSLTYPLMLLGVFAPLIAILNRDWAALGAAVVVVVPYGAYIHRRVRVRVVERTPERALVEVSYLRPSRAYAPLRRRTTVLLAVGWVVVFVALAFLPDDQAVGADILLVLVTFVLVAYRLGQRRGAARSGEPRLPPEGGDNTHAAHPHAHG